MPRILFVIDSLEAGGKERRLTELMKALHLAKDVEFELVLMNRNIHYKEVLSLGINIHYIIRKTRRDISIFHKLYHICKKYKPDIVHCWESMTAIYTVPVCRILKIKCVNGMVIDTPVRQNLCNKNWFRARLTFPFSSVVVGNSYSGLSAYRAPEKKSVCIHNGIAMSRFRNLQDKLSIREEILGNADDEDFIAGMVAGIDERKDYSTLIEAAVELLEKHDNLKFLLVGEGSMIGEMKKKVPESLKDKIVFLGKRTDIESIINIFDTGILLTNARVHGEGISNSIIEYMAMGKPVIATRGGGTNEIVEDNITGFLISPSDAGEFISKFEILFLDPPLRKKMGAAGKERIIAEFSMERMVSDYLNLYNDLIQKN